MKLGGVIVCKDYGDYLEETLPYNIHHFDHLVVVTHHSDKVTQAVCAKYSVECVQAHVFDEDGDRFNKGRAVNVGLAHLPNPDWILHLDADIVLPPQFRQMLDRAKLNPDNLYGCDRVNIKGYKKWLELKECMFPHYKDHWFVEHHKGHEVGARIIHREHGFVPIGFFQLFSKKHNKKYPIYEGTAEHSDVLFAIQWHRNQRVLLPEVICYHLETEDSHMSINWHGRKSKPFGCCKKHGGKGGYCPQK